DADGEQRCAGAYGGVAEDHSSYDLERNTFGSLAVAGEHSRTEAERGVIGHLDGVLLAADPVDDDGGAEALFVVAAHPLLYIGEHDGLDISSASVVPLPSGQQGRTLADGVVDLLDEAVGGGHR